MKLTWFEALGPCELCSDNTESSQKTANQKCLHWSKTKPIDTLFEPLIHYKWSIPTFDWINYLISSFAKWFFEDIRLTTSPDRLHFGLDLATKLKGLVPKIIRWRMNWPRGNLGKQSLIAILLVSIKQVRLHYSQERIPKRLYVIWKKIWRSFVVIMFFVFHATADIKGNLSEDQCVLQHSNKYAL